MAGAANFSQLICVLGRFTPNTRGFSCHVSRGLQPENYMHINSEFCLHNRTRTRKRTANIHSKLSLCCVMLLLGRILSTPVQIAANSVPMKSKRSKLGFGANFWKQSASQFVLTLTAGSFSAVHQIQSCVHHSHTVLNARNLKGLFAEMSSACF